MIDEKKFMDFMKALEENGAEHISFDDLRRFIDEFPKIYWIPCGERLPENISTVIVQVKEIEKPTFGWYEDMEKKWVLSEKDFVNLDKFTVIAWQPLPGKYQE